MVNGSRYYRALESVSIASALSIALTIHPCQIRVHQTLTLLNSNFLQLLQLFLLQRIRGITHYALYKFTYLLTYLQLGRRSGGRPQRTVYPRRLPVSCDTHSTLAGIEPTTFRLLVRRATSRATETTNVLVCDTIRYDRIIGRAVKLTGTRLRFHHSYTK